MLTAPILLLLNSIFFSLRLSGSGNSFPRPLHPDEEQLYLERCAAGDLCARNLLIEHNLRLVAHIIKKYYTQTADQDDLISIGTIGLIKGITTYRPDKGARLATYAARCIENEILMHFRSQKRLAGEISLSDAIETDRDGNTLSLMDVISVDDCMLEDLDIRENCLRLRRNISACLSERESKIIALRYGLNNQSPKTQREIASLCGISRSYVSRIEKRALKKLEESMAASHPSHPQLETPGFFQPKNFLITGLPGFLPLPKGPCRARPRLPEGLDCFAFTRTSSGTCVSCMRISIVSIHPFDWNISQQPFTSPPLINFIDFSFDVQVAII